VKVGFVTKSQVVVPIILLIIVSILEVEGYITDSHPDLILHNVLSHHVSEWIRGGFLAPHCHVRSCFESVCAPIDPISYMVATPVALHSPLNS
jgi:hypothetical protein